jgi:predicted MFS family arabinose efflux permease
MPTHKEMKFERPNKVFVNLLQMAAIAAVSFVFFFFIVPHQPGRGAALVVFGVGGGMAIRACWNLSHHAWFRITLSAIFVVQGCLIFLLPWSTERFPGIVLVPFGLVDFAVVYGIVKLVQKLHRQEA